jgi:hypothetical protein
MRLDGAPESLYCVGRSCISWQKRHLTIKFQDLTNYMGVRAKRGNLLPKGYQNLSKIEHLAMIMKPYLLFSLIINHQW